MLQPQAVRLAPLADRANTARQVLEESGNDPLLIEAVVARAGVFAAAQIVESEGLNLGHRADADTVAEYWGRISDFSGARHYTMGSEQTEKFMARLQDSPIKG